MARPKKTIEQTWYDLFADADPCEQASMLRILEEIHRQTRRGKLSNGKQEPEEAQQTIELTERKS